MLLFDFLTTTLSPHPDSQLIYPLTLVQRTAWQISKCTEEQSERNGYPDAST